MKKNEQAKLEESARAKQIEDMLFYMSACDRGDINCPNLDYFDGAIMMNPSGLDLMKSDIGGYGGPMHNRLVDEKASSLKDLHGAFICAPTPGTEFQIELGGGRELVYQERERVVAQINERIAEPIKAFSSRIIEIRGVGLSKNGIAQTTSRQHWYKRKGHWWPTQDASKIANVVFTAVVGYTVAAQTRWQARLRIAQGMPSIGVWTDPTGVKDLFKFRDVPDGRARRDALLHWVQDHWRQDREDPEVERYVREHLRGSKTCRWNTLEVEIEIPPVDKARVESLVTSRHRMKQAKIDKRIKALRAGF